MAWFSLQPSGNPIQPSDYTLLTNPPTGCSGTNQICAVQATTGPGNTPVLSAALKDEMIEALHNRTASTNVELKNA
ncbi:MULTISPECIES: hypothetical protein [unclassified Sphingobacterium]|uniref:hypothetical protein n=1 Tax=Sphingobacterium TaxID=28453 RepID=UPI00104D3D06|nr:MULTISPECIES: hypothetical protein [unclassified Sphingobacterium]MCS3556945.1 hypothetical protein [Sphingobacterium sp. JUb21]TCQ98949.1 hypothetical protein EDF66_11659 [Sphingobacterium sp. JUb20]